MPSRRLLVALVTALGLAVFASPAGAASKPFTMVVLPASVPAGQSSTFSVTLTNQTGQQELGSAEVTVPSAFANVSAPDPDGPASATVTGNVVRFQDLGVAPGGSVTVRVTANVPAGLGCSGAVFTWGVVAKQANDFNGPPGNDLTLNAQGSSLTTTVSGGCALRFVAGHGPANARVGQTISATALDPAGPSLQVEVVDGAGNRVTSSSASITIALGPSMGSGALHGTTTVTAIAGVASFANLSIDARGTYTLRASAGGLTPATSNSFRVDQVAVPCIEDVTCFASITNGTTTFSVTAPGNAHVDAGALFLDNGLSFEMNCGGYAELTATPTVVEGPARAKIVTATIDKSTMNKQPNNGASFLQMCFGANFTFTTRPNTSLTPVDTNSDGVPDFFYGLLPDCGTEPCVSARNKTNAGDGVIVVKTSEVTGDPAYRP